MSDPITTALEIADRDGNVTTLADIKTIDRDSVSDIATFDELVARSAIATEDLIVIVNPYTPLNKDKDALLNQPFFCRNIIFTEDKVTHQPYAILFVVARDNTMYVMTDGSSGIYKQLPGIIAQKGRAYDLMFANGLRKSEFGVNKKGEAVPLGDPTAVSNAATYYLQ